MLTEEQLAVQKEIVKKTYPKFLRVEPGGYGNTAVLIMSDKTNVQFTMPFRNRDMAMNSCGVGQLTGLEYTGNAMTELKCAVFALWIAGIKAGVSAFVASPGATQSSKPFEVAGFDMVHRSLNLAHNDGRNPITVWIYHFAKPFEESHFKIQSESRPTPPTSPVKKKPTKRMPTGETEFSAPVAKRPRKKAPTKK